MLSALVRVAALATALWRDPGNIAALDFRGTMGDRIGMPKPPFTFVKEDGTGTQPKLTVRDANGLIWNVKFGYEVKPESFGWRLARATGYFAEPNVFVASGQILGLPKIQRSNESLKADGQFTGARFQYRYPDYVFLADRNWRWDSPPYGHTKELSGLKILIMLVSNWDNKDARVGKGGPNTAIFRHGKELVYAFTDWGSGMGRSGEKTGQTNWRCEDYSAQTAGFVKKDGRGNLIFNWGGAVNPGFKTGIPASHAAWFLRYVGQITDSQLAEGLRASGATDAEVSCYVKALRSRIDQLREAVK